MSKVTLNTIASGYAGTTALNTNFADIESAFDNTLSLDGSTPNAMGADLDMNGNSILNIGDALVGGVSLADSVTNAAASAVDAAASAAAALVSETNAAADAVIAADAAFQLQDLEYKGAWVTTTLYLVNNFVYVSSTGSSYICLVEHTSGTFSTDLGNGYWGLLATQGAAGAGTGDMLKSENLSGLADYGVARSNMGLTIGTNVQAYDAELAAIAALAVTDGNIIVGDGATWVAESGATARTSLGLAIGSDVQAYDADTLKADTADVLTAGFASTVYDAGTKSSGTFTLDEANGNLQKCVNGGAHTLAPPVNDTSIVLQVTNNASAGAVTTSGWTKVTGTFTTTDGDDFMCYCTKIGSFSHLHIQALQ